MPIKSKGFTLIELLVVIAIIAVLSTIAATMYSTAQKSARITKRIGDLRAVRTALELYKLSNGKYPVTAVGQWNSQCPGGSGGGLASDLVIPGLVPTYLPAFPADPSMNIVTSRNCYLYQSPDGTDYKFLDHQVIDITDTDWINQRNYIDPARDGGTDPCKVDPVSSPGVHEWAIYTLGGCAL